MPIPTTYPGVYLEELPGGNQNITPAATSIAAFVGRAPFGLVDDALTCFSYGDFNRFYGGLSLAYPMSYAVQDFFNNGGSQAVIARLFEPAPGAGTGYAQLPFPVSPPLLPDGWMLDAAANVGDASLSIIAPLGSEGEPIVGELLTLGNSAQTYTVTSYAAATAKAPASMGIFPSVQGQPGQMYAICTSLTFQYGPSPAQWTIATPGQGGPTIGSGVGIPDLGDTFTVATATNDQTVYTITAQPVVTVTGGNMQVQLTSSPKLVSAVVPGAAITFSPPQLTPRPAGWQIHPAIAVGGAGTAKGTLSLVNGTGTPLPGDQFTVGSNATVYLVTGYTPAGTAPASLAFGVIGGGTIPTQPSAFCPCCQLSFTRPVPQGFVISKGPGQNGNTFTIGNNGGAASGVIDVGYTFMVQNDPTVYTIVIYNQATGMATFLPGAAEAFSTTSQLSISPPLQLQAISPGGWGNFLTATVDTNGITAVTAAQFQQYDIEQEDLFNLTLVQTNAQGRTVTSERYLNLAVKNVGLARTYPNRIDRVLNAQSSLAAVAVLSMVPPVSGVSVQGTGGNDGEGLSAETYIGDPDQKTGLYRLDNAPLINLLCIPPDQRLFPEVPLAQQDLDPTVRQAAAEYCTGRRAIYIVDPPAVWDSMVSQGKISQIDPETVGITGESSTGIAYARNAALYFPRVYESDVLLKGQTVMFPACGLIAGAIAATDVARGVWKAPAGTEVGLANVSELTTTLTDAQNGILNPLGINCLRTFPVIGPVVWGARTLMGADQLEDAYKYLSVRRLTLFIEDSLYQSTQWAVFEPNTEALWSSLRLSVNSFLADLARQGAFYNYLVTCDATTTTPTDIANGVVNILVQIAPVYPAEFVVIQIQQIAATSAS